jgi:hypothetical protein
MMACTRGKASPIGLLSNPAASSAIASIVVAVVFWTRTKMIRTCRRIPRDPNVRPKRAGQPVTVKDLRIITAAGIESAVHSVCSDDRDMAAIVW